MRRLAAILALALLAAVSVAACGGSGSSSATGETTASVPSTPPQLEAAIAKAAASGVPVRIPPQLLESPPAEAEHAEVLRSPADSYTLGLAAKPDCRFESSCVVAIFSGSAAPGAQLSGDQVKLAAGIEGVYEPGRCGPGCKFGTVAWRQDGDTYGVGVPNASVAELTVLANEAIEAEPVAEARK